RKASISTTSRESSTESGGISRGHTLQHRAGNIADVLRAAAAFLGVCIAQRRGMHAHVSVLRLLAPEGRRVLLFRPPPPVISSLCRNIAASDDCAICDVVGTLSGTWASHPASTRLSAIIAARPSKTRWPGAKSRFDNPAVQHRQLDGLHPVRAACVSVDCGP